jgi:hypothetical protein
MKITFQMVQLTIGVLIGFGWIFLGYKLFALAITKPGSGKFKIPGFVQVDRRTAAGVFFALIGALVIYLSVAML